MMAERTNMIDSVRNLQQSGMNRKQAEALTKLMRASIAEAIAEAVQHLATKAEVADLRQNMATKAELAELRQYTKAELAELRAQVDAQHMEIRAELAELRQYTKAELAELRAHVDAQHMEIRTELDKLKAAHDAQVEHNDSQIALLKAELIEKMSENLKYIAFSVGFSTIAIIAAFFIARFAT